MAWFKRMVPILTFLLFHGSQGLCQSASVIDGNIYFKSRDGQLIQLTDSGLDSDANLSADGQLVVFVRRTPPLQIETGLGKPTDKNELWIADTKKRVPPRRVLRGHPGGLRVGENLVLAGFSSPQFSPDTKRIYFLGQAWATSLPGFVLDVDSGKVRFLYDGQSIQVITSGKYAGYLIANKQIPRVVAGRVFRYWLLDSDGKEVGEIGETKADLELFKEMYGYDDLASHKR